MDPRSSMWRVLLSAGWTPRATLSRMDATCTGLLSYGSWKRHCDGRQNRHTTLLLDPHRLDVPIDRALSLVGSLLRKCVSVHPIRIVSDTRIRVT
ncbi:hypothetical protein BDA96_06G030100 [Sorghum bicolor]|uniref:Uncharacterized protein n=1 Tax=Sorghum bicolor TaxID=4558 RepID=A0A921QQR1_SORBI|nr:hypothetical protein BDA96_06G030100 [Sorghum bicolor]